MHIIEHTHMLQTHIHNTHTHFGNQNIPAVSTLLWALSVLAIHHGRYHSYASKHQEASQTFLHILVHATRPTYNNINNNNNKIKGSLLSLFPYFMVDVIPPSPPLLLSVPSWFLPSYTRRNPGQFVFCWAVLDAAKSEQVQSRDEFHVLMPKTTTTAAITAIATTQATTYNKRIRISVAVENRREEREHDTMFKTRKMKKREIG